MQPTSPDPQYDFILKDRPKQPRISFLAGMPPVAQRILLAGGSLIVLILLVAVFFGSGRGAPLGLVDIAARAHEISRVSGLADQAATDAETQSLAATVSKTLSAQEVQLSNYLSSSKHKAIGKSLFKYQDSKMDTQIQTAAASNTLRPTYTGYLKTALQNYKLSLQTADKTAGSEPKAILKSALESVDTILTAPQLKP